MENKIYVWKPITSPADLPKEESEDRVPVITKGGAVDATYFNGESSVKMWLESYTAYLCPLTVDNIPEWVSEKATELYPIDETYLPSGEEKQYQKRQAFHACASLLIPLINQGKGGDK